MPKALDSLLLNKDSNRKLKPRSSSVSYNDTFLCLPLIRALKLLSPPTTASFVEIVLQNNGTLHTFSSLRSLSPQSKKNRSEALGTD
jgi:hypothetical protein